MSLALIKTALQKQLGLDGEILGSVLELPYKEQSGQIHLWKREWRALVAVAPSGPLVLMSWIGQYL